MNILDQIENYDLIVFEYFLSWLDIVSLAHLTWTCSKYYWSYMVNIVLLKKEMEMGYNICDNQELALKYYISYNNNYNILLPIYILKQTYVEEKKDLFPKNGKYEWILFPKQKYVWFGVENNYIRIENYMHKNNCYYYFKTIYIDSKKEVKLTIQDQEITRFESGSYEKEIFSIFICPCYDTALHNIYFTSEDPDFIVKVKAVMCDDYRNYFPRPKLFRINNKEILLLKDAMTMKINEHHAKKIKENPCHLLN